MQKYFIGIPHLSVYEMSPFHDNYSVFKRMLEEKNPCVFFEEKTAYAQWRYINGEIDDLFGYSYRGADGNWAVAAIEQEAVADVVIICPGGMASICLAAAEKLIMEEEIEVKLCVPSKLYPCRTEDIAGEAAAAGKVLIVEEGTSGGSWGEGIAVQLYSRLNRDWGGAVELLCSRDTVIPAAVHHERRRNNFVSIHYTKLYDSALGR